MKKLLYILAAACLCFSCEDFLDSENYTEKNDANFPVNETDINQMLSGVYATMNVAVQNGVEHSYFFLAQMASDDCYGGGGQNDKLPQAIDHLLNYGDTPFDAFWSARYSGINRANSTLASVDNLNNEELRNQKRGEALFLRAYYYFELAQMFEKVPLINAAPSNVEEAQTPPRQATAEEIYTRIATDLKEACEIMPAYKWNELPYGTASRWAAEALLARVYLFYTGFYSKSTLPSEDGEISKDYVTSKLQDCIDNSGHALVADFRSLWPYSNSETKKDYAYAEDAPAWAKDGENPEQVFVLNFAYQSTWVAERLGFANEYCLYFGLRNNGDSERYENTYPFGEGWGMGPVTPTLWNEWGKEEPNDIRREASIYQVNSNYAYGADHQMEETGLWQKKIISTACHKGSKRLDSFCSSDSYWGDGETSNFQVSHCQALTLIRYADVLLMQAELKEDANYLNMVRARAGLSPKPGYSLQDLQQERRHELAFEGVRWGDIRRWGIAEEVLSKQLNQKIWNDGLETQMKDQGAGYVTRYKSTRGFFPLPPSEVALSAGALTQNAGWDSSANYSSWN